MNHQTDQLAIRLLATIEHDILPLTTTGVAAGNKIFGAALLRKCDLSTVLAETNNELENPLWHGEMHLLKRYYELPHTERVAAKDLLFLSTHEPCSLCLSAITWAGFDNFYYLFSHLDSRDNFAIPHDLKILKEVFDVDPGGYKRNNQFWQCYAISELIGSLPDEAQTAALAQVAQLEQRYTQLSNGYQDGKQNNDIPLN